MKNLLLIILLVILLSPMQSAQAKNCSGGKYDGHPALVDECQHVREVKINAVIQDEPDLCIKLEFQRCDANDPNSCITFYECPALYP